MKWREEILNYFKTKLTNAKTEGFNNLAKLYQKRAFGYKNFENYRLRLLNAGIKWFWTHFHHLPSRTVEP